MRNLLTNFFFIILAVSTALSQYSPDLDSQYSQEFNHLQKQLADRKPEDPIYQQAQQRLLTESKTTAALILPTDRDPLDVALRRTDALVTNLLSASPTQKMSTLKTEFKLIQTIAETIPPAKTDTRKELFHKACQLRRKIAFANPLLNFDRIIFLKHHRARYNHMVDQYYGFHAVPGGGVYTLNNPFSDNCNVTSVLQNSALKSGSFISLDLSCDAKQILFAWTQADPVVEKFTDYTPHETLWTPDSTYHIFKADTTGKNLRRLTDGKVNEFDPVFLPSGKIAFISERRGGYLRCGLRPDPVYTLHCMNDDGSDIHALSYHETHEWHPSVNNDGMIAYTRWDYVDRDSDIAHHIWLTYPDGADPRSYHGNYPEKRELRPWMEMSIRSIPDSHKYIAVATPHHGQAYGSLVLIDQHKDDDNSMSQLKRITPMAHFPESEIAPAVPHPTHKGAHRPNGETYACPWPLSEDFYICVADPFKTGKKNYGIYLVDSFGNHELLYRDPEISCLDPIPFTPRTTPPIIPTKTKQAGHDDAASIAVMNVYDADFDWPENTKITALRIIQLFPKTTAPANQPRISIGQQSLARGVLGTVPVEADGSAYFNAPHSIPIYFQALNEQGLAVQTMRSDTYLHPGETLSCQGCHEKKRNIATTKSKMPIALKRPPSTITPEHSGAYPLSFPRLVQPVLDKHCQPCHQKEKKAPSLNGNEFAQWGWSNAYHTLAPLAWAKNGGNGSGLAANKTSYSIPGQVGAKASKLYKMLEKGHHDLKLPPEDLKRITLWIDCNSNFYGTYHDTKKQAQGQLVKVILE